MMIRSQKRDVPGPFPGREIEQRRVIREDRSDQELVAQHAVKREDGVRELELIGQVAID